MGLFLKIQKDLGLGLKVELRCSRKGRLGKHGQRLFKDLDQSMFSKYVQPALLVASPRNRELTFILLFLSLLFVSLDT